MCTDVGGAPNQSRFREAALAHLPDLLGSAFRLTRNWEEAQVLAQDTLVGAYHRFGALEPGTNIRTWLLTVMVSTYVNRGRGAVRTGDETERGPETEGTDQPPPEAPAEGTGAEGPPTDRIQVAVNMLPEELRLPVVLHDVESMSYRDIARALEIPLGVVRARIFLGRQRLQESLAD